MYHRPYNSIRQQLTYVKDRTEKLKKFGVVYHVNNAIVITSVKQGAL